MSSSTMVPSNAGEMDLGEINRIRARLLSGQVAQQNRWLWGGVTYVPSSTMTPSNVGGKTDTDSLVMVPTRAKENHPRQCSIWEQVVAQNRFSLVRTTHVFCWTTTPSNVGGSIVEVSWAMARR